MFYVLAIVLIVWWCFLILTACHLFILRCLMHVKLNVIKLFNHLSLLANQNTSASMQQTMSMVSTAINSQQQQSEHHQAPAQLNHIHNHNHYNNNNNANNNGNIFNHYNGNDDNDIDFDCQKTNVADAAAGNDNNLTSYIKSNHHQKFIMSSSFQLHEDDLSKIDVKSLVSSKSNILCPYPSYAKKKQFFPLFNFFYPLYIHICRRSIKQLIKLDSIKKINLILLLFFFVSININIIEN